MYTLIVQSHKVTALLEGIIITQFNGHFGSLLMVFCRAFYSGNNVVALLYRSDTVRINTNYFSIKSIKPCMYLVLVLCFQFVNYVITHHTFISFYDIINILRLICF